MAAGGAGIDNPGISHNGNGSAERGRVMAESLEVRFEMSEITHGYRQGLVPKAYASVLSK